MAELATIARPYAEALFKAMHCQRGRRSGQHDCLGRRAGGDCRQPRAAPAGRQPQGNRPDQVFAVITGVARSALPDMAKNFLRTIIDNGRINTLGEVAVQYRALVNRRSGSSDAVVYSAFPLDNAALAEAGWQRWKSALAASSISPFRWTSP